MNRIPLAVSACLLGEAVRYDGASATGAWLSRHWYESFELIAVCPEVELGMPVPREPIDLHATAMDGASDRAALSGVRLRGRRSGHDWTEAMRGYAVRRIGALLERGVCGVVLKSRSPSCGLGDVWVHFSDGRRIRKGTGLFAAVLREMAPDLPVISDKDLMTWERADGWLAEVFARARSQLATGDELAAMVGSAASGREADRVFSEHERRMREAWLSWWRLDGSGRTC